MKRWFLPFALVLCLASCGTQKRIKTLRSEAVTSFLALPGDDATPELSLDTPRRAQYT